MPLHGLRSTGSPSSRNTRTVRTPEQARQKIFAKDEGEYVDFVEKG